METNAAKSFGGLPHVVYTLAVVLHCLQAHQAAACVRQRVLPGPSSAVRWVAVLGCWVHLQSAVLDSAGLQGYVFVYTLTIVTWPVISGADLPLALAGRRCRAVFLLRALSMCYFFALCVRQILDVATLTLLQLPFDCRSRCRHLS